MTSDSVKLDDDGIPVLENPVTLDALPAQAGEPLPDLTDHEVVARLLQNIDVQHLLDDMAEDLQKLVAWKIESLVKDQVTQLIQRAIEESGPKLAEDIHTQLQLALPGLLANLVEQAKASE
jgi:uncharacterized membrane-anchored protein YjiN (DUF445 family)